MADGRKGMHTEVVQAQERFLLLTGFALPLDGIHEFADSKTYVPDPPAANLLGPIDQLTLQARDRTRPYIRLVPDAAASSAEVDAEGEVRARSMCLTGTRLSTLPCSARVG